jgi:DNA-damage-inducible protein D
MSNIKLFESKQIRSVWNKTEQKWYFVIADVVRVLTNTSNTKDYIKGMRKRDQQLSLNWRQIVIPLPVQTAGGIQPINCASVKNLMRIIQAIPPCKAKSYKQLLAQVGSKRLAEIENPELLKKIYKLKRKPELSKGTDKLKRYPGDRLEERMASISIRKEFIMQWINCKKNTQF